jgi:hypothetical protein
LEISSQGGSIKDITSQMLGNYWKISYTHIRRFRIVSRLMLKSKVHWKTGVTWWAKSVLWTKEVEYNKSSEEEFRSYFLIF